jgi:hypothetical protein
MKLKSVDVELKPIHEEVLDFIEECYEQDVEMFGQEQFMTYSDGEEEEKYYRNWLKNQRDWEYIYLRGNCYFFAEQLHKAFENSKIVFRDDFGHAAVEIEGLVFDVRGIVADGYEYVDATPLMHLYGKCWGFHEEEDGPTSMLYPRGLFNILQQKSEEVLVNNSWDILAQEQVLYSLDRLLYGDGYERWIGDLADEDFFSLAEQNGWDQILREYDEERNNRFNWDNTWNNDDEEEDGNDWGYNSGR